MKQILLLSALSLPVVPAYAQTKTTRDLGAEIEASMGNYSQTGSLYSRVPKFMREGRNGYVILTENYVRDNSKELQNFVRHKESLGFKVTVVTEDDFGKVGSGRGRRQADKVRAWLQENWQKKNLLYALIISNPHPDKGVIPMAKFGALIKDKLDEKKLTKFTDENTEWASEGYAKWNGTAPTDFYYTDLTSDFDSNKNTVLNEKDDYKVEGAIDAVSDIYVGRIPYHGEDHEYGKVADVDVMLRRTIDYENEKGDLSYRNGAIVSGGLEGRRYQYIKGDFMAYNGAKLYTFGKPPITGPQPDVAVFSAYNIANTLNKADDIGFTILSGHGSAAGMAGMSTNYAKTIKRKRPVYIYFGGCDVGSPEHANNVVYASFRHYGIGAVGGTRSVTSVTGDKDTFVIGGYARLTAGQSMGEAHWQSLSDLQDGRASTGGTNILLNLYGDPSVVIVPQDNKNAVILSPNLEVIKLEGCVADPKAGTLDYFLKNGSDKKQSYTVTLPSTMQASETSFELEPKTSKSLTIGFKDVTNLGLGTHEAKFSISSNGQTEERHVQVTLFPKNPILNIPFDSLSGRKRMKVHIKPEKGKKPPKFDYTKTQDFLDLSAGSAAEYAKSEKDVFSIGNRDLGFAFTYKLGSKMNKSVPVAYLGRAFGHDLTNRLPICAITHTKGKLELLANFISEKDPAKEVKFSVDVNDTDWNEVIFTTDRARKKAYLIVNGKKHEQTFNPSLHHGMIVHGVKFNHIKSKSALHVKDLLLTDYFLDSQDITNYSSGKTIKRVAPIKGAAVSNKHVNLQWDSKSQKDKFVVTLAENPQFTEAKVVTTSHLNQEYAELKDKTTYYWKVERKGAAKSDPLQISSFTTDSSIKGHEVLVNKARLRKPFEANVKDNLFTFDLSRIIRSFDEVNGKRVKVPLLFSKVEGDNWLTINPDGNLFTPFGAPTSGTYKFKATATAPNTQPVTFEFTVIAK